MKYIWQLLTEIEPVNLSPYSYDKINDLLLLFIIFEHKFKMFRIFVYVDWFQSWLIKFRTFFVVSLFVLFLVIFVKKNQ